MRTIKKFKSFHKGKEKEFIRMGMLSANTCYAEKSYCTLRMQSVTNNFIIKNLIIQSPQSLRHKLKAILKVD